MYARIVQVPLKAGTSQDATTYFRESLGPVLKAQAGFLNSRFLVDDTNNRCLMVTLWESVEARSQAETEGVLKTALADMKPYFDGPPTVDYYDVTVQVA